MQMVTEVFGEVAVVHTPQEFDEVAGSQLKAHVAQQVSCKVVADLDGTERIDSAGLESLVDLRDQLRGADGDLRISAASPVLRKILEITRLDNQLEVYDCILDAVRSYG